MSSTSLRETEIWPTDEEPFKDDLLGRKELVESLAGAIESFRESHVVAIDGGYGTGKTTVLRFLEVLLEGRDFRVAVLNAWEHDYRHPLESLLNAAGSASGEDDWRSGLKDAAKAVLPELVAELGPPGTRSLGEQFIRRLMPDAPPLAEFRRRLESAVKGGGGRVVFLIDELDRCRPDHAVGILEWSKHAFSIDGVHFVLGVHVGQLAHTVEKLYGSGFDGLRYLDRLIHMTVRLPPASVRELVERELGVRGVRDLLASRDRQQHPQEGIERLVDYLVDARVSARSAIRAVALFDSTLRMLPEEGNRLVFVDVLAAMIVLKMAVPDSYSAFVSGKVSDLEIARELEGLGFLRGFNHARRRVWFHFVLMHAHREIARGLDAERDVAESTPLLERTVARAEKGDADAKRVLEAATYSPEYGMRWNSVGTLSVLKRIEWLAPF